MKKNKKYNNVVIITDDGEKSINTFSFWNVMTTLNKKATLFYTENKVSAKSNSISLIPIKYKGEGSVKCMDSFPADCLLFNIFNKKYDPSDTLFIFGVNEHNHFGYGNYVSSTTSLVLLAKHFGYDCFAISSEIYLPEEYIHKLYYYIIDTIKLLKKAISFNINILNLDFKIAEISKARFDEYEYLETNRGPYYLLTYNQKPEIFKENTDGWYQVHKKNYIVELF